MFHNRLYKEEFVNLIQKILWRIVMFQMVILTSTFISFNKHMDLQLEHFLCWTIYKVQACVLSKKELPITANQQSTKKIKVKINQNYEKQYFSSKKNKNKTKPKKIGVQKIKLKMYIGPLLPKRLDSISNSISTQFPTKGVFTPHRYKRTLRVHLMSN